MNEPTAAPLTNPFDVHDARVSRSDAYKTEEDAAPSEIDREMTRLASALDRLGVCVAQLEDGLSTVLGGTRAEAGLDEPRVEPESTLGQIVAGHADLAEALGSRLRVLRSRLTV